MNKNCMICIAIHFDNPAWKIRTGERRIEVRTIDVKFKLKLQEMYLCEMHEDTVPKDQVVVEVDKMENYKK